MNVKSLLILVSLLAISISLDCESFTCGSFPSGTCSQYNSATNTWALQACDSTEYCDSYYSPGQCTSYSSNYITIAGGSCTSNSECYAGQCTGGYCSGTALGGSCTYTFECGALAYCPGSTCVLLGANGSSCEYTDECVHGSGCLNGICTSYFSIANNSPLPNGYCLVDYMESVFCQSFACNQDSNGNEYCISPVGSSNPIPHDCTSSSDCLSNTPSLGRAVNSPCVCGYNPTGQSYCDSISGDSWGVRYVAQYKYFLSTGLGKNCNRDLGSLACAMIWWDKGNGAKYLYYSFMWLNEASIYGAETCVLNTAFPNYSSMVSNYTNYSWASLVTATLFSLTL